MHTLLSIVGKTVRIFVQHLMIKFIFFCVCVLTASLQSETRAELREETSIVLCAHTVTRKKKKTCSQRACKNDYLANESARVSMKCADAFENVC